MDAAVKNLFKIELAQYKEARINNDHEQCYKHLGRAHIISQKNVIYHLYTHLLMLNYSIRKKDISEVLGQILRLIVTVPGHIIGRVPYGNIGWADVKLTQEMPLPEDLKFLFK